MHTTISAPPQSQVFFSKWFIVLQASSAKGEACEISEQSGLRGVSHWPKNGHRGNLLASKLKKIFWGSMPPDLPSCSVLMHLTTSNMTATALVQTTMVHVTFSSTPFQNWRSCVSLYDMPVIYNLPHFFHELD